MPPDFTHEAALIARGAGFVVGVDEAGRGPLAGPVVAAAVRLDPDAIPAGLDDSKKLTVAARERLFAALIAGSAHAIAQASVEEIDRLNILQASLLAMRRAIAALPVDHALIDGNRVPAGLACPATALVGGDGRSLSIAAASILAKVTRDRIMVDLAQQFPGYGWERNKGYPAPAHLRALLDLGPTPVHRRTFAPVHKILYQAKSLTP
jgi:ribonuclease HII